MKSKRVRGGSSDVEDRDKGWKTKWAQHYVGSKPGVVVGPFNPSTWKVDRGRWISECQASLEQSN